MSPAVYAPPALDPALMYDLRARSLSDQALGAIHDHAQNTVEPTEEQLALIADFQRTDKRFFSSDELQDFASGGPAPVLPPGKTKSEKRGRLMFVEADRPLKRLVREALLIGKITFKYETTGQTLNAMNVQSDARRVVFQSGKTVANERVDARLGAQTYSCAGDSMKLTSDIEQAEYRRT